MGEVDGAQLSVQARHDQAVHHRHTQFHWIHDQFRDSVQHGRGHSRDDQQQNGRGESPKPQSSQI